jgi:hypothetical protein
MKYILQWLIAFFSKPKRFEISCPIISPIVIEHRFYYTVIQNFTIRGLEVEEGFVTDGASIPSFLWSFIGVHPLSPEVLAEAIGHDFLYLVAENKLKDAKTKDERDEAYEMFRKADNWFYDALRVNNRHVRCKLMFLAVRVYSTIYYKVCRWKQK